MIIKEGYCVPSRILDVGDAVLLLDTVNEEKGDVKRTLNIRHSRKSEEIFEGKGVGIMMSSTATAVCRLEEQFQSMMHSG